MSKAILVMDMPKNCNECEMCIDKYSLGYWCHAFSGGFIGFNDTIPKPDWCPLKPVPKKIEVSYGSDEQDWEKGYNSCVEEILDI